MTAQMSASPTRRATSTIRYAFDEANRLLISDPTDPLGPTRILEGTVTTDQHNRLVYQVKSTSGEEGPRTVNLDGAWKLTPNHELVLALHETKRQARQRIYLKGALVKAEANRLVFALRRSEADDLRTAQRLSLAGRWEADAQNRLNFLVEKGDGSEDRLIFQGGWEVGPHHELLYRYRQRVRTPRTRDEHMLAFAGAWDITRANHLVYRLAGSDTSAFEFKVSLQSPSLLAQEGRLAYQVGIGISQGRTETRRVVLFGAWKLHKDLSVSFEIPYANGRSGALRFEGTWRVSAKDQVAVLLHDALHRPLGITVLFTRKFLKDASLFLRLRQAGEERSVIGGIQVKF